jgi:VanZ family protein
MHWGILGANMKKRIALLCLWTVIVLGLLLGPIGDVGEAMPGGFRHWDKVAHFGLFGITGLVAAYSANFFKPVRVQIVFGLIFGLLLAMSSEAAQELVAYRTTSFTDLLADVAGLAFTLLLYALLRLR